MVMSWDEIENARQQLKDGLPRFYCEPYKGNWSVWDRVTNTNNGFVYGDLAEAQQVCTDSIIKGAFSENGWNT